MRMEDGCVCLCEQTAPEGFSVESPGQKTHESAASRIYCELIKLAFVLRPWGEWSAAANIGRDALLSSGKTGRQRMELRNTERGREKPGKNLAESSR